MATHANADRPVGNLWLRRQVLSVYKGHKWAFIEEHIHDVLGKQSRDAGDFEVALQHFAAMLQCSHSPPYWQTHYLKQFLDTVAAATKAKVGATYVESSGGIG